jgi:hypothetical protein
LHFPLHAIAADFYLPVASLLVPKYNITTYLDTYHIHTTTYHTPIPTYRTGTNHPMRLSALIPAVLSAAALILSFLCLFAGSKQGFMEDYAIVTVSKKTPLTTRGTKHRKKKG